MAEVEKYLDLITAFHRGKPKFSAMVEAVSQCFVGAQNSYGEMVPAYDLDAAVGVQLDAVGEWVGISRNVRTPLEGVYFSFDVEGLGFGQGVWQGPFDPDTGITSLDDETYRILIRAKIGANHWDGTLESSAAILNSIFSSGTSPIPIHANAEPFGIGDGASSQFQLQYQGRPVYQVESAAIYRNDWQGNQRLYPTERTNFVRYSEDGSVTAWRRLNLADVIAGFGAAPNGTMTSSRLVESTGTGQRRFIQSSAMSGLSGLEFTQGVFVRPDPTRTGLVLYPNSGGNGALARFNLTTGEPGIVSSIGTASGASGLVALDDGWYFAYVTVTFSAPISTCNWWLYFSNDQNLGNASYTGDGVSGIEVWGASFIPGPVSSYFKTEAAPVSLTDYSASPTGLITMSQVPDVGASLTWTGDGEIYPAGTYVFIQDNGDMSIDIGIAGERPTAVFLALLTGGYIPIKPEGVRVNYFIVSDVDGPLFGFDVNNQYLSGFDVGAWGDLYPS